MPWYQATYTILADESAMGASFCGPASENVLEMVERWGNDYFSATLTGLIKGTDYTCVVELNE